MRMRELELVKTDSLKIEFKAKFDAYMKREQALETNMTKAYAFLWSQCSKAMQNKIEGRSEFISEIKGDPIKLMKAIKQHSLHYQDRKYEMAIVYDALRTMINLRQRENESLQEYTKRFKTSQEVMELHLGGCIELPKYMAQMKEYDSTDPDKIKMCKIRAYNQLMGYMYMENADKVKYGTLLSCLQTQISLGNNQYPKTLLEANNVLSNFKADNNLVRQKFNNSKKETNGNDEVLQVTLAQLDAKCKYKDKPKSEWAINKSKNKQQSHLNTESRPELQSTDTQSQTSRPASTTTSSIPGWGGVHMQFFQSDNMKDVILLDNQSTVSLFCNHKMVRNIRRVDQELVLQTNAGTLVTDMRAEVPQYGEVWYHPDAITNIFSFAEMEDKHPVRYNSKQEHAFIVSLPHKELKFTRNESGLYVFKPPYITDETRSEVNMMMDSVEENAKVFTEREI
jgi:hypothetical protein